MLLCAGFLGGVVSLVGEYAQRAFELLQDRPYYELRDEPGVASRDGRAERRAAGRE